MKKICAIILAAGKGTRLNSQDTNKVVLPIGGKPMILYEVELLKDIGIGSIIVVVGFAKESVNKVLGKQVVYVEQNDQPGTASAVLSALPVIPQGIDAVLVIQGDDGLLFSQKGTKELIIKLIQNHIQKKASISLLTYKASEAQGMGRIIRNENGEIIKIAEEKDATNKERQVNEFNCACYVFSLDFVRENIHKLRKSSITSEYYLTDLIELASVQNKKIISHEVSKLLWQGVNTPSEFVKANELFLHSK